MEAKDMINNVTKISGMVTVEPELSHVSYDEKFYQLRIKTKRFSGSDDNLIVIVSEKLIDISKLKVDTNVSIFGELRTYNIVENKVNKLKLVVFVKNISILDKEENHNEVNFVGYICKEPIYRKTPLGREICDVIVAINRNYHKSSYVPVISWGRNAKYLSDLNVGDKIECMGRLQSRPYNKKTESGEVIEKIAYEVSLSKIKKAEDQKED